MLEHQVDGKDVHVLKDSANPHPTTHCQVSEHDRIHALAMVLINTIAQH